MKLNINLSNINVVKNKLAKVKKVIKDNSTNEIRKKRNTQLYNEWYKKERVQIFKTAGANIGQPFPRVKRYDPNFKKKRKYKVAIGFAQGVWSGATYYVLQKEVSLPNRKYMKQITHSSIRLKVDAGKSDKYLNFRLGISDKLIEKHKEGILKDFDKQLKDANK